MREMQRIREHQRRVGYNQGIDRMTNDLIDEHDANVNDNLRPLDFPVADGAGAKQGADVGVPDGSPDSVNEDDAPDEDDDDDDEEGDGKVRTFWPFDWLDNTTSANWRYTVTIFCFVKFHNPITTLLMSFPAN